MKIRMARRNVKIGPLISNLFLSAIGCFIMTRCFRAITKERADLEASEDKNATYVA